jgi:outer membrane protein assembly factor BamE
MRLPEDCRLTARPPRVLIALLLVCLAQGGCVYRMAIQQGNFLEPRLVDKLEIGMTRAQVRYLLGTPMVPATFDADRWDYLYYLRKGRVHAPLHRRLTVFFAADKVARVEKEGENAAPVTEPVAPVPSSPPSRSGA